MACSSAENEQCLEAVGSSTGHVEPRREGHTHRRAGVPTMNGCFAKPVMPARTAAAVVHASRPTAAEPNAT
jgi:hypothetical protein